MILKWLSVLKQINVYLGISVAKSLVEDFIEKVRPVDTGIDLIRIGPKGDGGYLVPNRLKGIYACFSPGIGNVYGFEEDCLNYGMQVFMADKSVDLSFVKNERLDCIDKFVGPINNDQYIRIEDWVNEKIGEVGSGEDLLLQMDIEGAEFPVILDMTEELMTRFRIITFEVHALHKIWRKELYDIINFTFDKLLKNHYCVHIHPNNVGGNYVKKGLSIPKVAEFTFLRKNEVKLVNGFVKGPHPLEEDNDTNIRSIRLAKEWYG